MHMKTGLSVEVAAGNNNAVNVLQEVRHASRHPCTPLLICLKKPR